MYSVPTAAMNDYTKEGSNRYGTPKELENTVQELTMNQDRSFTFTIDRGNYNDTQMITVQVSPTTSNQRGYQYRKLIHTDLQKSAQVQDKQQQEQSQKKMRTVHFWTVQVF